MPAWLVGLGLLLAFAAGGEALGRVLHLPLPGSVLGAALLYLALATRLVRPHWVERAADTLLGVLGLLFVPAGVGLLDYLGLWRAWPVWFGLVAVGSLLGGALAGKLASALEREKA